MFFQFIDNITLADHRKYLKFEVTAIDPTTFEMQLIIFTQNWENDVGMEQIESTDSNIETRAYFNPKYVKDGLYGYEEWNEDSVLLYN